MNEELDIAKQIADVRRGREELDRRKQENSAAFDSLNSRLQQIDEDIKQMREHINQTRNGDRNGRVAQTTASKLPDALRLRQRREDLRDYAQTTRDLLQLAEQNRLVQRQKGQDSFDTFQDAHEEELRSQLEDQALRIKRQAEREHALGQTQTKLNRRDDDQMRREKFLNERDESLRKRHVQQNERERILNERERALEERERRLNEAERDGIRLQERKRSNNDGNGGGDRNGRDGSRNRPNENPRPR